jgi:hypothetical protein
MRADLPRYMQASRWKDETMAFGIPGTDSTTSGPFLGRIQYDARVGFWKTVDRIQDGGGDWSDRESELFQNPTFALDFGSFEVGYIKLTSPPSFLVVPMGATIPVQPEELGQPDAKGKTKKAFQPGFRCKVVAPKIFGDGEPRYFSATAKTVMGPMENLWTLYTRAPEAAKGLIPIVAVEGSTVTEIKTLQGKTKFYAPNFVIKGWTPRPDTLGAATVPLPSGVAPAVPPVTYAPPPPVAPAPAAPPAKPDLDDEIPF